METLFAVSSNREEISRYIEITKNKTYIERGAEGKEKTGVEIKGVTVINPANKKEIPIYIADYVLGKYGTGAVMAVPAHDERDFVFAQKFGIGSDLHDNSIERKSDVDLVDSKKIVALVKGKWVTKYKLRDWVFSRQRYWGEPIPMVHCDVCGWQSVPEDQLPVTLPEVEKYQPTETGESPLAMMTDWVNTSCPLCNGPAKRETDVMPNWAGSSWYYLRYCDPDNTQMVASPEALKYWTPVDWYNGGMEHTTLHLLYSRFWHKFLYDIGVVQTLEPYQKRTSHGLILAGDGSKMSKSKGNTVNPDEIVEGFGADSLRLYEMFMGPFDQHVVWNTDSILGVRRFLGQVYDSVDGWKKQDNVLVSHDKFESSLQKLIIKVSDDIEAMKFNTAIPAFMIFLKEVRHEKTDDGTKALSLTAEQLKVFLTLLAPFAPHICAELWEKAGFEGDVSIQPWPIADQSKIVVTEWKIVVQINGKVRATLKLPVCSTKEDVIISARGDVVVAGWLEKGIEKKVIYVSGKIVNFVMQLT